MDGSRFDDLTRFMAETPSRRTVVKALVGAIAGSLASVGTALGAPRCKRINQACQTTADCCPGPTANGNVYCKQISKKAKVCATCPAETPTACNGGCVDTNDDNLNCGTCGTVCHGTTTCVNGSCQCPAGQTLGSDGACHCPAGQHLCADGSCQECCSNTDCDTFSDQVCCDGTCVYLGDDEQNCGGCGIVCSPDQSCVDGDCECNAPGQIIGPNGTCVCAPVSCSSVGEPADGLCCDGWFCDFDSKICEVCRPAGTDIGPNNSERACCSNVTSNNICVNRCLSDSDCQTGTGQICNTSIGVCGCPSGMEPLPGGACP